MKRILVYIMFMVTTGTVHAQLVMAKVVDSSTGNPLPYAGIIYAHGASVTYTDAQGVFYINRDSLFTKDSVSIEYLGFYDLHIPAGRIKDSAVFKMIPRMSMLNPVIVSNCSKQKEVQINKNKGRIHHYIGPGPETKFVIISKFNNREKKSGYINRISIYTEASSTEFKMPIRIRWYKWNDSTGMPGQELTNTEILVTPYQPGWNNFDIPASTIYCEDSGCVLGFEFIYPAAYVYSYQQIKTDNEKIQWLNDMKNRWSLGTILSKNSSERCFYIINNLPLGEYVKQPVKWYVKPAVTITVKTCIR